MASRSLDVRGQLQAGDESSSAKETRQDVNSISNTQEHEQLEDVRSRAEDTGAVHDRTLQQDEEEGEEEEDWKWSEGRLEASPEWSHSESSSEGEGQGGDGERTESGYMLLSQDPEPGDADRETLEQLNLNSVGEELPPRMSKWLQKQVDDLSKAPPSTDWAKFDDPSPGPAGSCPDWPGSGGSAAGHQGATRETVKTVTAVEEQVEPATKLAEGSHRTLAAQDPSLSLSLSL